MIAQRDYAALRSFWQGDQYPTSGRRRRDEVRVVANYAADLIAKHTHATIAELGDLPPIPPLVLYRAIADAIALGDAYVYWHRTQRTYIYLPPESVTWPDPTDPASPATVRLRPDYTEIWEAHTLTIQHSPGTGAAPLRPTAPLRSTHRHPWPRPPLAHIQGAPDGSSMLEQIAPLCRALNERISQWLWLMRTQASPPIVTRGLDRAVLRVEPGEIWPLPQNASADILRLLDGATANIHIQAIHELQRIIREVTGTPEIAYGFGSAQLSGAALEQAMLPLTTAARTRAALVLSALQPLIDMIQQP